MKTQLSIGLMTLAIACASPAFAQKDYWGEAWSDTAKGVFDQDRDGGVVDLPKKVLPDRPSRSTTLSAYDEADDRDLPPSRRGKKHAGSNDDNSYFKYKLRRNLVFKKGRNNGYVGGKVRGYDADGYDFIAGRGQNVEVEFLKGRFVDAVVITKDDETLMLPVENLPYTGKYTLRILQPRNKARENTTQSYKARVWIYD